MIASIFFLLFIILVIVRLSINYESKKRGKKLSEELALKEKLESEKRKLEITKSPYKYKYWNKIIDGSEPIDIDKSEVSSQVILDNWNYISKYYYVIKEEANAMRNDTNFKEEQIVYELSTNQDLTKTLYKRNLKLTQKKIIDFLTNILENSQKLRKTETNVPLKVISVIYSLRDNSGFYLCAEPSRVFYKDMNSNFVPEFELRIEYDIDIYAIENAIFNDLNIIVGDYYDEYSYYTYDLFSEMMFECWKIAKEITGSELLGTLDYGSGGMDYDLDTKEKIDFNTEEHFKNKDIVIEKDLEN